MSAVEVRIALKEVSFFVGTERPTKAQADLQIQEIRRWCDANLTFRVNMRFDDPTAPRRTNKMTLRRWLNKHGTGLWTWTNEGVAFANHHDATHFKLVWA